MTSQHSFYIDTIERAGGWRRFEFPTDCLLDSEIIAIKERAAISRAYIRLKGEKCCIVLSEQHEFARASVLGQAVLLAEAGIDPTESMIQFVDYARKQILLRNGHSRPALDDNKNRVEVISE